MVDEDEANRDPDGFPQQVQATKAQHDVALGIDGADLISQTPSSTLLPGETWIYAATFEATESLTTETRVTATVTEDQRSGLDQGVRRTGVNAVGIESITVEEDQSLPGFGDSVGAGFALLGLLVGLLIVFVGLAVPFLWLLPVVGVIIWLGKRHDRKKAAAAPEPTEATGQEQDEQETDSSGSAEMQAPT